MISPNYLTSHSTIVQMVDNMIMNQELKEVQKHKKQIPPGDFRRELQTVKVHLPRQSGHTTAAGTLWATHKALIIYPRQMYADLFMQEVIGRKHRISYNKFDPVNTRCMAFNEAGSVSRAAEKFLAFASVDSKDLPELLVFDQASGFGRRWGSYDREKSFMLQSRLDLMLERGEHFEVRELFHQLHDYVRRPEETVEDIAHFAFLRIPTLKGVVILQ